MIGNSKVDFSDLRSKVQVAREKFLRSKDITKCNREAIVYICDQLLEGIDKNKFRTMPEKGRILLIAIDLSSQGYCIKMKFRNAEMLRTFKCKTEVDMFVADLGAFVNELGCEMKLIGRIKLGSLEIYYKC